MFSLWEDYKFIDFYNIPHSFYLFRLLSGKIQPWKRLCVCVCIIYIGVKLYHAMLHYI